MNNPQQLKERIYALNPELKALTMGCAIKLKGSIKHPMLSENIIRYITDYGENPLGEVQICGYSGYIHKSEIEILGKPITLNEIIYAMREQDGNQDSNILKLCGGSMSMWNYKWTFDQNIAENEELVTFLLSIIK